MLIIVNVSFSQDSRIFDNVWYLKNIIENEVNNFPPNGNMNINFASNNFSAYACNTMYAGVTFGNNNTTFSASNFVYTLNLCEDIPVGNYQETYYFPFFQDSSNPNAVNDFTYTISELQSIKTLTINSKFNKQAVFTSAMLSTDDFIKSDFSFSPNPSHDYLEINLNNGFTENTVVEFHNEMGQICKTVILNHDNSKIELNNLSTGIYFVKIKNRNETFTRKLIKI